MLSITSDGVLLVGERARTDMGLTNVITLYCIYICLEGQLCRELVYSGF